MLVYESGMNVCKMLTTGDNINEEVQKLIAGYTSEIESLRTKLLESEANVHTISKTARTPTRLNSSMSGYVIKVSFVLITVNESFYVHKHEFSIRLFWLLLYVCGYTSFICWCDTIICDHLLAGVD